MSRTREAQELLAAGWTSAPGDSRMAAADGDTASLVEPQTWYALRELGASLPIPVRMQLR